MGNVVMKEDGFTPLLTIESGEGIPDAYRKIAQDWIDKLAAVPDVRWRSKWMKVTVFEPGMPVPGCTQDYLLQCSFETLHPCFPEPHKPGIKAVVDADKGNIIPIKTAKPDMTAQLEHVRGWLGNAVIPIHMEISPLDDSYILWIALRK